MNILEAIAQSISPNDFLPAREPVRQSVGTATLKRSGGFMKAPVMVLDKEDFHGVPDRAPLNAAVPKPVLQLSSLPLTINPDLFKNARSNSNPNGDLKPLRAFRDLVDPVPCFTRYYTASGSSTEITYRDIVSGATVGAGNSFVSNMFSSAAQRVEANAFANMDQTPGDWCPVYAVPEDWYDTSQAARFQDLHLDLTDAGGPGSPFTLLGGQNALHVSVLGDAPQNVCVDAGSELRSVTMKYLSIQFNRPWLSQELFQTSGWSLSGQPEGFCSSGRTDDNTGVLPLLTVGLLLAMDVSVDATWGKQVQSALTAAKNAGAPSFLGPFALDSTALQVIGWVSTLVPLSPK